jgi:hypothetical protein
MTLLVAEPLTVNVLAKSVIPEPPRPGGQGSPPCRTCTRDTPGEGVWSYEAYGR